MSENKTRQASDLLMEATLEILRLKIKRALGDGVSDNEHLWDKKEQDRLLKIAEPILQGVIQREALEAKSANDVLKLLSGGKVSIGEAQGLMGMLSSKFNMDELPKLVKEFEAIQNGGNKPANKQLG